MNEQYTEAQQSTAESWVADDGDHGSAQLVVSIGAGIAVGIGGILAIEPLVTANEIISETAPAKEPILTDTEALSAVGGAAVLSAVAVYMGIRKYAINRIGKDRYKALK